MKVGEGGGATQRKETPRGFGWVATVFAGSFPPLVGNPEGGRHVAQERRVRGTVARVGGRRYKYGPGRARLGDDFRRLAISGTLWHAADEHVLIERIH